VSPAPDDPSPTPQPFLLSSAALITVIAHLKPQVAPYHLKRHHSRIRMLYALTASVLRRPVLSWHGVLHHSPGEYK
jgi:hypothetical protein